MQELNAALPNLGKNEVILDVRGADEYAEGHVPGSINIDHESVGQHLERLKKYDKLYIHCRGGKRAQFAANTLINAGITQLVCINDGGFMDWVEHGYPVEK